ncbi:MAG TPA: phosphoribosylglycinamide formyltransferase [Candidatus Dietzia intestinipullorum]|nr:phosphoribosylglycinamide formyltransferase [Candidatus Dietzia intestinipullorum]
MRGTDPGARRPIVLLASGAGSLAQSILDRADDPDTSYRVAALVSDRDCEAAARADRSGVPTAVVRPAEYDDRAGWDRALTETVGSFDPDWIVSAGFMRILGPAFLERFDSRVVNSHPALLPSFPGVHAVRDALAYGVAVSGCTVHLVDAGVDTGPVIAQRAVEVLTDDTEGSLHERIKVAEREMLADVLTAATSGRLHIEGRKVHQS